MSACVNVLLISSLPHVRDWVQDAARGNDQLNVHVRGVRHVEAGTTLLRAEEGIDLVVIDLDSAGLGAVDVGRIWSVRPGINIAVTRWLSNEVDLVACVRAGALGYLPKELSPRSLAFAMWVVAQGVLWCPNLREQLEPAGNSY